MFDKSPTSRRGEVYHRWPILSLGGRPYADYRLTLISWTLYCTGRFLTAGESTLTSWNCGGNGILLILLRPRTDFGFCKLVTFFSLQVWFSTPFVCTHNISRTLKWRLETLTEEMTSDLNPWCNLATLISSLTWGVKEAPRLAHCNYCNGQIKAWITTWQNLFLYCCRNHQQYRKRLCDVMIDAFI